MKQDTLESLKRYQFHHIPTGDFLKAVLSNNLIDAIGRADDCNLQDIHEICSYVYNEMPSASWGSPEKVKSWLKGEGGGGVCSK